LVIEDPQILIETVCNEYCGKGNEFSSFLILFDEFGRFLEYAAENPGLAGDSALQQIFQGVQDNKDKCYFLGMIQYELKTYLKRVKSSQNFALQRYITRYDTAQKTHLSSNLETLFAHLMEKKNPEILENIIAKNNYSGLHSIMTENLPNFEKQKVWRDFDTFMKVIVEGCWPLHPTTVWFLSETQDIVQKRSAISFIENELNKKCEQEFYPNSPEKSYIYPVDLCMGDMFQEILASEKIAGGIIAQQLDEILKKYRGKLEAMVYRFKGIINSLLF